MPLSDDDAAAVVGGVIVHTYRLPGTSIRVALTHAKLAEVLGAQRTTVTELLTAEVAAGRIVKARGYLQIVDLPAMRAAAR